MPTVSVLVAIDVTAMSEVSENRNTNFLSLEKPEEDRQKTGNPFWTKPEWRPHTRADCKWVPRPCPYVACRHNTYASWGPGHRIKIARKPDGTPYSDPLERPAETSCVLDLVEKWGPMTYEEIAEVLGLSRERVRQLIQSALANFWLRWTELDGELTK